MGTIHYDKLANTPSSLFELLYKSLYHCTILRYRSCEGGGKQDFDSYMLFKKYALTLVQFFGVHADPGRTKMATSLKPLFFHNWDSDNEPDFNTGLVHES